MWFTCMGGKMKRIDMLGVGALTGAAVGGIAAGAAFQIGRAHV